MKKTTFLVLSLALPIAACQNTKDQTNHASESATGEMKSVAPGAAESMVMTTFEFKKANP